jgi:AcrR family transcriptional regulator
LGKQARKRPARGGPAKGRKTRETIVGRALHVAASEGLGAISIGRLAKDLHMSKSGLFIHFGSKEKLQVAVIERAGEIFSGHVLEPAEHEVEAGIERVWTLCDYWLAFVEHRVLPGGYFFTGAFFVGAEQHGLIAQRIRDIVNEWLTALRKAVNEARHRFELRTDIDAERTTFELNGLLLGAQWSRLLDHLDHSKARLAILAKLKSLATDKIPLDAFDSMMAWRHYLGTKD